MAGYALPATVRVDPGVCEATNVFVASALISSLCAVHTQHDCRVAVHIYLSVSDCETGRLELRVLNIREELGAITDFPVVFGINEVGADHRVESPSVSIDLGFVPQALHKEQFG